MRFSGINTRRMIGVGLSLAVLVVGLAAAQTGTAARATNSPGLKRVIIVLRNQNRGLSARSARRRADVRAEQAPIVAALSAAGARTIVAARVLNFVIATVSAGEASRLAANPAVAQVIPDGVIPAPSPPAPLRPLSGHSRRSARAAAGAPCGTAASPELDPEALTNVNARPSQLPAGIDGAGVTVAYIADGVDPSNPDFQRNAAYALPGSPAGSPVLTQYNFNGDPAGTPTEGGEAFLDASSIAAQGNETYDLSQYVSSAHALPIGCDVKIVGAAPGANVMGLDVFSTIPDTMTESSTTSNFLQAIDYAAANGAKVINESFGSNPFPDTALDAVRQADDVAVGAGLTVVVSSGDGGITSTVGSPASDPALISVGASTTFRAYRQVTDGGINDPRANGSWVDDNISALSSGGFTQSGNAVNLVAPGDSNWALCSPDLTQFSDCFNLSGTGSPIQLTGGTSESAPLTAGAAADVIQAYASTHRGSDPSPALVKQILTSTATDIGAPATQQGAGLLNVAAAVRGAESIAGSSVTPSGGLLVGPIQINVAQQPGASSTKTVSVTNTGSAAAAVSLSTRTLSDKVSDQSGSFCMQPGAPTASCPANTGTFPSFTSYTEVYQEQTFTVPATSGPSRLKVAADYHYSGQTNDLGVDLALLEPDGTYAAYSVPGGLAGYAQVEVANPPPGTWTAVFFTAKDSAQLVGTSGTVQWDASTWQYAPGGSISPSSLQIGAGQTATAQLQLTSPSTAGDGEQSVVVSSAGRQTTVPVTVRTLVPMTARGGTFTGVLTGGNGRDQPAQTNTYYFNVPSGKRDLETSVTLADDPGEALIALLVDPSGQTVGYSSNYTVDSSGNPFGTRSVTLYRVAPQAGQWRLVLEWLNPVTGNELNESFTGAIGFNQVSVTSDLPSGIATKLTQGQASTFHVHVNNTGSAPESLFTDPRLGQATTIRLRDQTGSDSNTTLPLTGVSPLYLIPTHTTSLQANLTGSVPVTFDMRYGTGDPDVSPVLSGGPVSGSQSGDSASLTLTEPEIAPGSWVLDPSEIGPYPDSGAEPATASASVSAVTSAFDPTVTSATGDFWSWANRLSSTFAPIYASPGASADIPVTITPSAAPDTKVSGTLYVDEVVTGKLAAPDGDELAAIPYSYQVK